MRPPAVVVLANPCNVRYNEAVSLGLARGVRDRTLRSGRTRLPLQPPRQRQVRRRQEEEEQREEVVEEEEQGLGEDGGPLFLDEGPFTPSSPGGGSPFVSRDTTPTAPSPAVTPQMAPTPSVPFTLAPAACVTPVTSAAAFRQRQIMHGEPRSPWHWEGHKVSEPYEVQTTDKWWSPGHFGKVRAEAERDYGHIGRIMETELGEERLGADRCSHCVEYDFECWVYSKDGARQVKYPGDACARCRSKAHAGGCSLSKRKKSGGGGKHPGPKDHVEKQLFPKGPPSPPPPGAATAV